MKKLLAALMFCSATVMANPYMPIETHIDEFTDDVIAITSTQPTTVGGEFTLACYPRSPNNVMGVLNVPEHLGMLYNRDSITIWVDEAEPRVIQTTVGQYRINNSYVGFLITPGLYEAMRDGDQMKMRINSKFQSSNVHVIELDGIHKKILAIMDKCK